MPKISKFFRVAVEGATADGRTIERQQLADMAATYNRDTYAARVNMEHIRGVTADPPFQALGDVTALKTEEVELEIGGAKVKKLALFAQLEPTDTLVAINGKRQKLYSSIEINPNFAASGKAYLMGLAVTDSPASLGTEMLQFVAGQREKGSDPYAERRQAPENLFVAAEEIALEFEDVASKPDGAVAQMIAAMTAFFAADPSKKGEAGDHTGSAVRAEIKRLTDAGYTLVDISNALCDISADACRSPKTLSSIANGDIANPPKTLLDALKKVPSQRKMSSANDNQNLSDFDGIKNLFVSMTSAIGEISSSVSSIMDEVSIMKESIDTTARPNQFSRSPASGGNGAKLTDC